MGANTNSGLLAAKGEFILQLQDDWLCVGPKNWLNLALELLKSREDVGLVRLRTPCRFEGESVVLSNGVQAQLYENQGYSRRSEYCYTDNPHLKRRDVHSDLGLYREDLSMPATELDFCARFDLQDRWRVGWINDLSVFEHKGELESFNACSIREKRIQFLAGLVPGGKAIVRAIRNMRRSVGQSVRARRLE